MIALYPGLGWTGTLVPKFSKTFLAGVDLASGESLSLQGGVHDGVHLRSASAGQKQCCEHIPN